MQAMPFNEEIERSVIGCMVLDPDRVIPMALQFGLDDGSFYTAWAAKLFAALVDMQGDAKRRIDLMTARDFVEQRHPGEGVADEVLRCVDATPTASSAEYYLHLQTQYALRRGVIAKASEMIAEARESEDGERMVMEAPQRFSAMLKRVDKEVDNATLLDQAAAEWVEASERRARGETEVISGLPTPFRVLNEVLCGLVPGLIIISGRPSQGKTTLEDNLMTFLAKNGEPVGRVTMDMTRKRLLQRALCREAGVSMAKLRFGFAGAANHAMVSEANRQLKKYPWHFLERRNNLKIIMSWIRSAVMHDGCKAISIDYIQQIMTGDHRKDNDENGRIGYVSSSLKALSLELNIPLLCVSQLSRAGETQDRTPKLSDLRGSGSLEQDAQSVIMVYQDKEVARENNKRPTWVDVQKQQDGETKPIPMWLYEKYFRFEEAEENFGVVPVDEDDKPRRRSGR